MLCRATLSFAFAGLAAVAVAQSTAPVGLLEMVARAPQLEAARKRIDAARVRVESSGRLADPEVEAMSSRVNADAMGENRDMWEVSVRQPLPKRGERAADRARAQAVVSLAEAEYAMAAGDLAGEVAMGLAEAEGADARVRLLETQLARLDAVLQSLETRLAAGLSPRISDRLTVQSRVAALQLQIEQTQRIAADARADLRGRLGLPAAAALPTFAAPAPTEINPADAATIALATARIAEASAMGQMARASAHPMTSVGVRFERERSSMGNQDTLGFAVSSEFPWRTRRYARADARAAEADRAAAQADANAARHRIASALSRVERAERVADSARRLAASTQARLEAEHEALNRATSVSTGTGMGGDSAVLHAVDILDKTTETQLQIIEAETTARAARAELWRYVSAPRLLQLNP
jgi:cobalt-zinc-cadmium efflux system outer membrane protein